MGTPIIDDEYRKLLKEHKQLWLLREQFDARPKNIKDRVALYKSKGFWRFYDEDADDVYPGFIYFSKTKLSEIIEVLKNGDITLE